MYAKPDHCLLAMSYIFHQNCNNLRKSANHICASHICAIPQEDQSQLRLLIVVNKDQIYPVNTQCGSHHTPTHITQSIKLGASQSPPLKSLTSSLGPTLWGSVSEPTRDYQASSNTICNNPRKSASHICAIPQNDQSQLRLLVVVNKAQIYPVNTRCRTHHTPTHITQSIKLEASQKLYNTKAASSPLRDAPEFICYAEVPPRNKNPILQP